jgi:23S rRNA pseudouridine1911/1915/1917 synthase
MLEPEIVYENENFLAVNKPSGLLVHGARHATHDIRPMTNDKEVNSHKSTVISQEPTLVDWLLKKRPEVKNVGDDPATRPGIVHRLDKDTSGIMLVAKTQEYFEYLKSLFQKHEIKKTYLAVVYGVPKKREGVIDAPIGIVNGTLRRSTRSKKMQKEAITEYRVLRNYQIPITKYQINSKSQNSKTEICSLLEVRPKTGRTHQIRVHLASIGHPIVGDKLYGKQFPIPNSQFPNRLLLHAASIEFRDRDGSVIKLSTEAPFALNQ